MCLGNFDKHSYAHTNKGNTVETIQETTMWDIAPQGWASDLNSPSKAAG